MIPPRLTKYLSSCGSLLIHKFYLIYKKKIVSDAQIQTLKGHFTPGDVHKQCAISFISPPYPDQKIVEDVKVSQNQNH